MIYLQIFWVFFVANIFGYGGGPAIIPLIQREVVVSFGWFSDAHFNEILAMGNALPGPIAPKIASYIGFNQAGVLGAFIGVFATVAPSLVLMISLMGVLKRHKDSPQVQRLSKYVRPTIAVLMFIITLQNFLWSWDNIGVVHLVVLTVASLLCIGRFKFHPVFVVIGALAYGAVFLAY
ncbi:MAG: chromate transporter [Defluviitaleaceae bacterium]|nr:chromate transporter [Defluviitaleaceae bacterium]